jgi:phosphatidylserine/phosphatidylglycerophosphate/cardiolipin synthase-like enzyme
MNCGQTPLSAPAGQGKIMAQFLNTIEISLQLENLIKVANEQLILISSYLKLNDRIRELLHDKLRQQVEVRIVYGKEKEQGDELKWLRGQEHIKISFCKNLHAKCYLSEHYCIVTSMNLYDFSQVNNNEMGIGLHKTQDKLLYSQAYEEAQRLIRISGENTNAEPPKTYSKLTTAKLAEHFGKSTNEMFGLLLKNGYLEMIKGSYELTEKGRDKAGGEKKNGRYGTFFLWNKPKQK